MFIKNDFLVSVSLDGISKIHNKNRAFASGKGSMDLVAKNTKKLLAHISNLNCQITLRREDIPFLEEAVTALWEMGVDKVYSNIVFDKNEIYQEKDYKELKFQTEILSDLMYQHLISGSKTNNILFFSHHSSAGILISELYTKFSHGQPSPQYNWQ